MLGCSVHLFAVISSYFTSKYYKTHFVMEVRDLWPQTFLGMGTWKEWQPQAHFFRKLEIFLFNQAEKIITLFPLTDEYLLDISPNLAEKSVYIPNGTKVSRFDKTVNPTGGYNSNKGKLIAMYIGAMG